MHPAASHVLAYFNCGHLPDKLPAVVLPLEPVDEICVRAMGFVKMCKPPPRLSAKPTSE